MTKRDQQTEAQLVAMAGAADRANRPRMLVIVCLLLAAAALVIVLASAFRFRSTRSLLEDRLAEAAAIEAYVDRSKELAKDGINFAELFPPNPSIADLIEDIAARITGPSPINLIKVSQPSRKGLALIFGGNPNLETVTVMCTFTTARTEHIFEMMERVLQEPTLKGIFVHKIDMRPREPGLWSGSVEFRRYVYKENAR